MQEKVVHFKNINPKVFGLGGTLFEFYEFTLYGVFSPLFAQLFFPPSQSFLNMSYTLLIFAIGSFVRPAGGLLFGFLGDYAGRKKALCLSVLMMAIPTFIIGILPGYERVGIWAPVTLILCRIFQGLSAGGEYNGAAIYLIESSSNRRQGFNGSLPVAVSAIGTLVAMLLGSLVVRENITWINWRMLFILGALGGVGIFLLRTLVEESPAFKASLNSLSSKEPFSEPLLANRYFLSLLGIVGIGCFGSVGGFTLFTYINIYLTQYLNFKLSLSMSLSAFGIFLFIILNPIMGYLSDRVSAVKLMSCGAILTALLSFKFYTLLNTGLIANILLAEGILAIGVSLFTGPMNHFMTDLFHIRIRYRGIAFGYTLGIALFGGTMPLISNYLIDKTDNPIMPALYLALAALIGLFSVIGIFFYKKKYLYLSDGAHHFGLGSFNIRSNLN